MSEFSYDDIKANKEDKTTEQYRIRQLAKRINFGTIYSMGPDKLSKQLWSELRIKETTEQYKAYLDKFFETYPGVRVYMEDTKRFVGLYGFVFTYLGRRRKFPIAVYDRTQLAKIIRQSINSRIQCTSADIVMTNLVTLNKFLYDNNLGRILISVHDSICMSIKKGVTGLAKEFYRIVTEETAKRCPWLPVEWKFDVGKGPNYGDTHDAVL